jgi:histidine triad (HIT) family protein
MNGGIHSINYPFVSKLTTQHPAGFFVVVYNVNMNNPVATHAPDNYICPICLAIQGVENDDTLMKTSDIVYKDDLVTVFINSFFMGKNAGHVIVVPNEHFENIYSLPTQEVHRIFEIAKKMALTIKKAYECNGITIRQNNEPAGDQHAFHFHLHVFPRYNEDGFNNVQPSDKRLASPEERAKFAAKLKAALAS